MTDALMNPAVKPRPILPVSVQAGPARLSSAGKWRIPLGPPPGSTFGARVRKDDEDIYSHNAWDHVELPDEYHERAAEIIALQHSAPVPPELREGYNSQPAQYWDEFYSRNQAAQVRSSLWWSNAYVLGWGRFFKDRAWLRLEFPELIACSEADAGPRVVLEVGCGAGNSIFTLMRHNENPNLDVYAIDYSAKAIEVVKANPMYPCPAHGKGRLHASVWDITSTAPLPSPLSISSASSTVSSIPTDHSPASSLGVSPLTTSTLSSPMSLAANMMSSSSPHPAIPIIRPPATAFTLPLGITPNSVDVITVIYVLSALHPLEWEQAIYNLYTALKPGGLLLIRDYGRHDLAQLRIKRDRLLDPDMPNLYIRGDGTRVYFFEKCELDRLLTTSSRGSRAGGMFSIDQLREDRRMIVNRKERKTMYRIWVQVKARKRAMDQGDADEKVS
ncbi:MAG: hypothetical protein TREMPRED_005774 [Tremellales sp. Tagirdzhanova-0007]|nr:MAG: hypothetical protein TREMPRED_005774 [Tremellales sp. Tagirdzhanova-0007]